MASHQPYQLLPTSRFRTALPTKHKTRQHRKKRPKQLYFHVNSGSRSLWGGGGSCKGDTTPFLPDPGPANGLPNGVKPQDDPKGITRLALVPEPQPFQLLPACPQASLALPQQPTEADAWGQQRPAPDPRPGGEAQRTAWPGVGAQSRGPAWAARPPRHRLGAGGGGGATGGEGLLGCPTDGLPSQAGASK